MSESSFTRRLAQILVLAMTASMSAAVGLAIADPDRSTKTAVGTSLALIAPVLAFVGIRAHRSRRCASALPRESIVAPAVVGGLMAIFIVSLLSGFAWGAVSGHRLMTEIVLLDSMRNLALGLAAFSDRQMLAKLCVLINLFLVCVASAMAEGPAMIALVAFFAVAGCLWLLVMNWDERRPVWIVDGPPRFPFAVAGSLAVIIAIVLVTSSFGPKAAAEALFGLVPTSGGTDWNDADSLGGVNDGDNEVSASENPQSVGVTSSDVYLETDKPSLYDAFNEQYGEPFKPKKQERMMPLALQEVREQKERPSENLQAGREFPLVRRKPKHPERRPSDRATKALVYVKGPCPLHLPLVAYGCFDGHSWSEGEHCVTRSPLEKEGRGAWLRSPFATMPVAGAMVGHQIKIGNLDSSSLPLPPHVIRLRMGSVDQPDFFGWAQAGIIRLQGRTVPAGTLIETESVATNHSLLGSIEFPAPQPPVIDRYLGGGDAYRVSPAIVELANQWTARFPRGWGQIESIVSALRAHCIHDRSAVLPENCGDPLHHFLFTARQGADYQFATAATVMLRAIGYPCRLVSGLYASPEDYDPRTRHTAVHAEDTHFWAEVRLPNGSWVAIEPTPNYHVIASPLSWGQWLLSLGLKVGFTLIAQRVPLAVLGVFLVLACWYWKLLFDAMHTVSWRFLSKRNPSLYVILTFRLLERRLRLAGLPRPEAATPRRWYGVLAEQFQADDRRDVSTLIACVETHLYATGLKTLTLPQTSDVCRRVIESWTVSKLCACRKTA